MGKMGVLPLASRLPQDQGTFMCSGLLLPTWQLAKPPGLSCETPSVVPTLSSPTLSLWWDIHNSHTWAVMQHLLSCAATSNARGSWLLSEALESGYPKWPRPLPHPKTERSAMWSVCYCAPCYTQRSFWGNIPLLGAWRAKFCHFYLWAAALCSSDERNDCSVILYDRSEGTRIQLYVDSPL